MATKKKVVVNDDPPLWLTALKLIVVLTVLIGGVGLALWFAKDMESDADSTSSSDHWGISHDSPLRMKR